MIELRWLKKTHLPEHDGATGFEHNVLQYRYQRKSPKKNPKLFEHVWEIKWSEWIDVPAVTEGK